MPVALPDLTILAAVFVVIAFILLVRAMVQGIISPLRGIPFIGGAFGAVGDAMVHALNSALGAAVHSAQVLVGASWHALANSTDWLWREIRSHANMFVALAGPVALLWNAYAGIRALVHRLTATNTHADARLKTINREIDHLRRRERLLHRELEKGIGEDVQPQINAINREIDHLRTKTIPAIKAADAQAESAISNLYEWAKGKASLLGVGTFAFAVAAVIGQEAFSLLRCSEFGGLWNKWKCGLWNLLDGLLGLVVSALALEHVCDFLGILEDAFGAVVGPVTHLLTEVPLGGCEQPPDTWPQLNVAAGPRPPLQTLGTFPS